MTPELNQRSISWQLCFSWQIFTCKSWKKNDSDPLNKGEDVLICPRSIIKVTLQREGREDGKAIPCTYFVIIKAAQDFTTKLFPGRSQSCLLEKQWWVIIWKLKIKNKRQNLRSYDNIPLNNLSGAAMDCLLLKFFKSGLEGFQEKMLSLNPKLHALLTEFWVRVSDLYNASSQVRWS